MSSLRSEGVLRSSTLRGLSWAEGPYSVVPSFLGNSFIQIIFIRVLLSGRSPEVALRGIGWHKSPGGWTVTTKRLFQASYKPKLIFIDFQLVYKPISRVFQSELKYGLQYVQKRPNETPPILMLGKNKSKINPKHQNVGQGERE